MISQFGLDILKFPLNFFVFLNFIFGIFSLSNIVIQKKFFKLNFINSYLFIFVILGAYISIVNYILFLNFFLTKFFIYLSFIIFFILNLKYFKKYIFFKKKIDLNSKFIIYFIFIYFVISSLPLSDGDSLSYHSAFGAYTLKLKSLNWLHTSHLVHPDFLVSGFTEIFNFIGLALFSENFGSHLNFFSLAAIIYFFYNVKKLDKTKSFIVLTTIASPILLPMIFSQKIFILPSFILAIILFRIFKEKNFKILDEILIISSLMIILSFKVSFMFTIFFAILFLVYKNKKNFFRTSFFIIIIAAIFFGPVIFKNIYFHNDLLPPFTGKILGTNSDYLNLTVEFLKSYDVKLTLTNLFFLPFLFLIPHYGQNGSLFLSLPNIGKIFGLQIYSFLFGNKFFTKKLNLFLILIFLSVLFTGNISTRWFLFLFFLLQISLFFTNIKINNYFKNLIYLQTIIFAVFLTGYLIYSIPSLFLEKYRNNYLIKHSNGYDFIKKVNNIKLKNNLRLNEKILFSHRSHYWTNLNDKDLNYANEWLKIFYFDNYKLKLNKSFHNNLKNENIKILIIREKKDIKKIIDKSFKKKCIINTGKFNANHATRNPFFSGEKSYNWIFFKNFNLLDCLKYL